MALPGRNDRRWVSGLYGELQLPAHRMGFDPSVRRPAGAEEIPEGVFLTDCLRLGSPSAERRGSAGGSGRGRNLPSRFFKKEYPAGPQTPVGYNMDKWPRGAADTIINELKKRRNV